MMNTFVIALLGSMALPDNPQQSANTDASQQVLAGTLVQSFKPTQQILSKTGVLVNDNGYRLESLPAEKGQLVITDLTLARTWLVDKQRMFIHEVPLTVVDDVPELENAFISLPGSLDSVPCSTQDKKMLGYVEHRGLSLQHWQCLLSSPDEQQGDRHGPEISNLPEQQYYSEKYNLVVYSKSRNHVLSELIDIRIVNADAAQFAPPVNFQAVSIQQFLGHHQALGSYQMRTPETPDTKSTNRQSRQP